MPIFDDTNRGVLFKNNDKTDDKHADYRGNVNVEGTEFWLDAWINTAQSGVKYMSLRLKPKTAAPKSAAVGATKKQAGGGVPFDDDVPFAAEFI
jgi:uncharacterized protein (DUF736 family)